MSRRVAWGLAATLIVAGGAWMLRSREHVLPRHIRIEEPVADLQAGFDRGRVVAEDPAAPARLGALAPGAETDPAGRQRPAIVTPAPARLRFRLRVPPRASLRFAAGAERRTERSGPTAPIRFRVLVDGVEAWRRTIDPNRKRQRRWFDEQIDLGDRGGQDVAVDFVTEPERLGLPPAGTPGWSRPRLVQTMDQQRQPARPDAPNVIVLLVDTLRADRLGFHGSANPTPVADALARRGLVFEQAIAASSWTTPSVASLLTGLPPRSHGLVGSQAAATAAAQPLVLADALHTLAEHVARAGITTMAVATNPLVSRSTNFAQGFETFEERGWNNLASKWPSADEVNAIVLAWVRANRRHRFFAYVHYLDPHDPYTPPPALRPPLPPGAGPEVRAGSVDALARRINWGGAPPLPPDQANYLSRLYDGEVQTWDRELGRLLDGLAGTGVLASTVVIVTADHGEEFQEHGGLKHGRALYEESIHVPLVLAGPGVTPGRVTAPVEGVDLYPTVCALLGVTPPPGLPGQNLLGPRTDRAAVSELWHTPDAATVALRAARWKLIRPPQAPGPELYDLAADPGERTNRIAEAAQAAALERELATRLATAAPPPPPDATAPDLGERLRALGYAD